MYFADGKPIDNEDLLALVPIHIVTIPSQLPEEFLEPSPERKLVVGFDCEGVDLCRHGTLCIMQVSEISWTMFDQSLMIELCQHEEFSPIELWTLFVQLQL